jgi:two-component system, LytTR family, response regulator
MSERDIDEQLREICLEEPETQWKLTDFVFLPGSEQMVQVKEICTLEVDQNYTQVTAQGSSKKFLVRRSLTYCESRLDPKVFVRANRECLVNLNYVRAVSAYDDKRLLFVLNDGREIILSKLCSFALRKQFKL